MTATGSLSRFDEDQLLVIECAPVCVGANALAVVYVD